MKKMLIFSLLLSFGFCSTMLANHDKSKRKLKKLKYKLEQKSWISLKNQSDFDKLTKLEVIKLKKMDLTTEYEFKFNKRNNLTTRVNYLKSENKFEKWSESTDKMIIDEDGVKTYQKYKNTILEDIVKSRELTEMYSVRGEFMEFSTVHNKDAKKNYKDKNDYHKKNGLDADVVFTFPSRRILNKSNLTDDFEIVIDDGNVFRIKNDHQSITWINDDKKIVFKRFDNDALIETETRTYEVLINKKNYLSEVAVVTNLEFLSGVPYRKIQKEKYSDYSLIYENAKEEKSSLSIIPSLANDFVNLTIPEHYERVEIFNSEGVLVSSLSGMTGNVKVNIADWSTGLYFVKSVTENFISTQKFIKQ